MTNRRTPLVQLLSIDGTSTGSTALNIDVSSLGNAVYDETGGGVEDQWTLAAHGLVVGARVQFSAVGTGASGYAISTDYWVASVPDANTFTLSATKGGSAIEGSGDSGGTWTIDRQAEEYYIQQTGDDDYIIERIIITLTDAAMEATKLGGITALTTGLNLRWLRTDDSVVATLTPETIKNNADFGKYAYDVNIDSFKPTGSPTTEVCLARWTFGKFVPEGVVLREGDKLSLSISEDLSSIDTFTITAEGWIDNEISLT